VGTVSGGCTPNLSYTVFERERFGPREVVDRRTILSGTNELVFRRIRDHSTGSQDIRSYKFAIAKGVAAREIEGAGIH
jgi:hypothetical protein